MTRTVASSLPDTATFEKLPAIPRSTKPLAARLKRIATEPFVHFVVLGALVFAAHRTLTRPRAEVRTLEVSSAKQRELTKLFEQRQRQPPTDAEREQLIQRYVEDEVLFREGMRLSLLQTDPMLRAQMVARVRSLLQAEVTAKPPTEEQLKAYYLAHHADYATPEVVTLVEYLFRTGPEAQDGARSLALSLQRGDEQTGANAPNPTNYIRRSVAQLESLLGPELAQKVWSLPPGAWRELSSSRGVHVIRVEDHTPASDPPFEKVRDQVLLEYRKEQTSGAFKAEVERLTSQWQVHVQTGGAP